jgi:hypothetical protein
MSKTSKILLRVAGSLAGLLVGGICAGLILYWPAAVITMFVSGGSEGGLGTWILIVGLGVLAGASLGATLGANIAQRAMRQRSSFWQALLGAVVGMVIAVPCFLVAGVHVSVVPILTVAGAVIGSGWGTRPAAQPGLTFTRQGNRTHCKKCGFELIGPGGPCRKCDDVETRPCLSCGRYVLLSDTACVYCGAEVK